MIIINVAERLMPAAAKNLSKAAIYEIIGAASIGAGGVNFILDKTLGPVVDKFTKRAKDKIVETGEKKKAALEEKKAAILAQKNADKVIEVVPEEVAEVAEKPKKASNNKKNK